MGIPTAFNFLGPLTNPAQPRASAVGCADLRMAPVIAEVFAARGDSALVMRGEDGLDEFTTTAPTRLWAVAGGQVTELVIDSQELGLARAKAEDLRGGDAPANAETARRVFAGEPGPVRDAVVLNTTAALAAYDGPGDNLAAALRSGIERAAQAIDTGAAEKTLARWVSVAQSAA
jgi:anthranilate phosphoribosyltransferase